MAALHITTKAMKPHLYYMSAWFCPFAHRATLALEHHSSHLTWEWIEALGWEKEGRRTSRCRRNTRTGTTSRRPSS